MLVRIVSLLCVVILPITRGYGCFEVTEVPDPLDYNENTRNLQMALDGHECVNVSGKVDWKVTGIRVPSDRRFIIGPDARISSVINVTKIAVVHVVDASNVTIEGGGMIYGSAENAWSWFNPYDDRFQPVAVDGSMSRPNCLLVQKSTNIVLRDLHIHNSTDWTVRIENSTNIFAERLDIYGDSRFPNNDGFDPVSSVNVTLVDSSIDVADDGVCPKASTGMGPLRGLTVKNVTIRSKSHAIKFGSNTDDEMFDCLFENITIWDSNGGMSIQQRSEGNIRDITFRDIDVVTRYQSPRWWGNAEWLTVTNSPRDNGHAVGTISNLTFSDIRGFSENGGLLSGISGGGIHSVRFDNIHVTVASGIGNYSDGPLPCYQNPVICSNDSARVCVEQTATPGSQISCLGSRDYRPTPPGNCSYYCRTASKAYVLFMENVHDVSFENVHFAFSSPRKPYFAETCIQWDRRTTGVVGAESVLCDVGRMY